MRRRWTSTPLQLPALVPRLRRHLRRRPRRRRPPVAFVTGYLRPDTPATLLIWQVAVDADARGQGIAGYLLDHLTARVAAEHVLDALETTISPGNTASERLFASYAERHGAHLAREVLFGEEHFPGGAGHHDAEVLHRIAPLAR